MTLGPRGYSDEFALVAIGGRARVIRRAAPWEPPMPIPDFLALQRDHAKAAKRWVETSPRGDSFRGIRFDSSTTDERLPGDYFNTWRGFAVEPTESGSWDLLRDHILRNVCTGREALFEYVYKWLGQLVQEPWVKPLVALLLYGETQGTGKDLVGRVVGKLLRTQNYQHIRGHEQITDAYNGATLLSAMFIHAEEVLYEDGKRELGKLKSLITAPRVKIRFMRVDPFDVDSFCRVFMTSNNAVPVHIEPSDRRFVTIEVPAHEHTNDTEYFGRILKELENGGYGRLMHDLKCLGLSGFKVQQRIHTDEHDGLRTASMPHIHQFVAEKMAGRPKNEFKAEVYGDYVEWCRKRGYKAENQIVFGRELARLKVVVGRESKGLRKMMYLFSNPCECRVELERRYPTIREVYDFGPVPVRDAQDEDVWEEAAAAGASAPAVISGREEV